MRTFKSLRNNDDFNIEILTAEIDSGLWASPNSHIKIEDNLIYDINEHLK